MYQALYRKYRPTSFSDVVGQDHITSVLKTQLQKGKVFHAYMFCGSRGTGKTTCAKILAKAVNCENPINGEPCNQCSACTAINEERVLDVVEMDAASNNGVDHIRRLCDEVQFLPSEVKKRVYIIDEVHMLSTSAFNALLKTIEEPPAHVLFILATTEINDIPATIMSRCQRFDFKRITSEIITDRLMEISTKENIPLERDAAAIIARLSDGAMRDALSLLEACQGHSGTITADRIQGILGLCNRELVIDLLSNYNFFQILILACLTLRILLKLPKYDK
jgi:DNA polymerase-3 subunit gamma/tau